MNEHKKLNERTGNSLTIEEIDARTEFLLQRTSALREKIKQDIEVVTRRYERKQNENR